MRAPVVLLAGFAALGTLIACAPRPDTRLADDQQSCTAMGHASGTPIFRQCLAELNERRCALERNRYGTRHVDSRECTRVQGQP